MTIKSCGNLLSYKWIVVLPSIVLLCTVTNVAWDVLEQIIM